MFSENISALLIRIRTGPIDRLFWIRGSRTTWHFSLVVESAGIGT